MIWLASYPRSGNTFFRIVLSEVYGIESSTFHHESDYPVDLKYSDFPIVKTHLLPHQLEPSSRDIPAVYLVRDGRDCAISMAHYRRDLIEEQSELDENLRAVIEAEAGSHFGGWSHHVRAWLKRATIVIRFEDLIGDPIGQIERLRAVMDLPEPQVDRLPSFQDLQNRSFAYGSGRDHGFSQAEQERTRRGKFRRGKIGGWSDVMPFRHEMLFLRRHGPMLEELGYTTAEPCPKPPPLSPSPATHLSQKSPHHVLLDGIKLADSRSDGIRRYTQGLMRALTEIEKEQPEQWRFSVRTVDRHIFRLQDVAELLEPGQDIARAMEAKTEASQHGMALKRQILKRKFNEAERLAATRPWLRGMAYLSAQRRRVHVSDYDLLHLMLPNVWAHYQDIPLPRVTTVHDLSHIRCPETMPEDNIRTLSEGLQQAVHSNDQLIAVSQFTQQELMSLYDVPESQVWVTHEGGDSTRFFPETRKADLERVRSSHSLPTTPFLLALATLEPRKNLMRTVRAFERVAQAHPDLKCSLLIAGHAGWGSERSWQELEASNRIRRLGYVDEGDLAGLYSEATAFAYVSHYEGFGLPPLESMSCGTPVIYGNGSAMPEVVGPAGIPVDANDEAAIARAMERVLLDSTLQQDLARQAVMQAHHFTWKKTAERTLQVYAHAIETGHVPARSTRRKTIDHLRNRTRQWVNRKAL